MIFYFSGTGNSLYIARQLGKLQNLEVISMADRLNSRQLIFVPKDGEPIGFVYPIYTWAPPKIVFDFIRQIQLARKNNYIFTIAVYGSNIGNANEVFRDALMANKIPLNADFSVKMPNSNIFYHDVITREQQQAILDLADKKILHINEVVSKRQSVSESQHGYLATVKSNLLNPIYMKFENRAKHFTTTKYCEGCGFCVKICPTRNISLDEHRHPVWGDNCVNCLACINRCPRQSIECGHITTVRGRYYNIRGNKKNDRA